MPTPIRRRFDRAAVDQFGERRFWDSDMAPELHEADATLGDESLDEASGHVQGSGGFRLGQQNLRGPTGWLTGDWQSASRRFLRGRRSRTLRSTNPGLTPDSKNSRKWLRRADWP